MRSQLSASSYRAVGSLSCRRGGGQLVPHRRTTGELIQSASIREPGADPHQRGELVFGGASAGYRSGRRGRWLLEELVEGGWELELTSTLHPRPRWRHLVEIAPTHHSDDQTSFGICYLCSFPSRTCSSHRIPRSRSRSPSMRSTTSSSTVHPQTTFQRYVKDG